jgi:hypothetical protein
MGKSRKQRILEKYGPNETNLNNHGDKIKVIQREQKHESKMRHARVVVYHRFKKIAKAYMAEQRRHIVLKVFGFWKYWLLEGKIGPTEDEVKDSA